MLFLSLLVVGFKRIIADVLTFLSLWWRFQGPLIIRSCAVTCAIVEEALSWCEARKHCRKTGFCLTLWHACPSKLECFNTEMQWFCSSHIWILMREPENGWLNWVKLISCHFFQALLKVLQPFNSCLTYFHMNCWPPSTVFRTKWHSACCESSTYYCPWFRQWGWGRKHGDFKSLYPEQHCTELLRWRRENQRSSGTKRTFRCGTDGFLAAVSPPYLVLFLYL